MNTAWLQNETGGHSSIDPNDNRTGWSILICLLGHFRVLRADQPVSLQSEKARMLLSHLGLQHQEAVPREWLLETLWPEHAPILASQSLNSLVYSLRKSLGGDNHDNAPILHEGGYYRLNKEAGVGIDVACFESLVKSGDQRLLANHLPKAVTFYAQAVDFYRGDLCAGTDINSVMARERLRAHFLTVLARLADYYFSVDEYGHCLHYADRLLQNDACREDAHRLLMRCYMRQGERAQALRQYRLCESILRAKFDAVPEGRTTLLFDQVRLNPDTI